MVRINVPSYGTLPSEVPSFQSSPSKVRRMQMFLALASVGLCLVVVASFASSSQHLSVSLMDASSESGQFLSLTVHTLNACLPQVSMAFSCVSCLLNFWTRPFCSFLAFRIILRFSLRLCRQQSACHWRNPPGYRLTSRTVFLP
jgi:hypothetical protein